jgi:hypothetical protein
MMAAHTWTGGGTTDNWSDAGNWVGGVAPLSGENDAVVVFNTTDASSVQDVPSLALTQLRFDAGSNVALTLAQNTVLRTETTDDEIVSASGQNSISGPGLLTLGSLGTPDGNTSINVSAGTLEFGVAVSTISVPELTKVGAGTLSVSTGLSDDNLSVTAKAGTILFNTSQRVKSLDVQSGAHVTLAPSATPGTRSLFMRAISFSYQGSIDLTNGGMIFDYDFGPVGIHYGLRSALQVARANGTWKGGGLTSSFAAANPTTTALGIAEKATATGNTNIEPILGQAADGSSILIRFTLLGDANLDGVVGPADLNLFAAHFGETDQVWVNGDFDYDRTVGPADFNLFAAQFGKTLSATPLVGGGNVESAVSAVAELKTTAAPLDGQRAVARTPERRSFTPAPAGLVRPSIVVAPAARRGAFS